MKKKRIVFQVLISICTALFIIYQAGFFMADFYYRGRVQIGLDKVLVTAFTFVLLSMIIFSAILNFKILLRGHSIIAERGPNANSVLQYVFFCLGAILFSVALLLPPSVSLAPADQHGFVQMNVDFGSFVYLGREDVYFLFVILGLISLFASGNTNIIEEDSVKLNISKTPFNRAIIYSQIALGVLTVLFAVAYCIPLTMSLIIWVKGFSTMTEAMYEYERDYIWPDLLGFLRDYFYRLLFIVYGLWILRDGIKLNRFVAFCRI